MPSFLGCFSSYYQLNITCHHRGGPVPSLYLEATLSWTRSSLRKYTYGKGKMPRQKEYKYLKAGHIGLKKHFRSILVRSFY